MPRNHCLLPQLELVLFDDALRHLLRLNRLIEMPRGSALLVGVGGSGKQSLTRLASYISRAVCFQITLTKTYGVNSFMEDLRCVASPELIVYSVEHLVYPRYWNRINGGMSESNLVFLTNMLAFLRNWGVWAMPPRMCRFMYKNAGHLRKPTVFLFTEAEIKDEVRFRQPRARFTSNRLR